MQFTQNKLISHLFQHLAAIVCVALTKLVLQPFEPFLAIQIIALLYLLPVMISTVLWGLTPGIVAGFTAFLTFNYFYIEPSHTLEVHQTQDLITLIIFLIVAVVMSQLIGQARQGVRLARSREWEATHMYELISALSGLQDVQSVAQALADHSLETFRFDWVKVSIEQEIGQHTLIVSAPRDISPDTPPNHILSMMTARGLEGEMRIWAGNSQLSEQETRLLEAYLSQGALALERIRLGKAENKAQILEESDQLKSSLLNSVSHELRSPLAAIKASVSSLRMGTVNWNSTARQELLATIEEETDHLNLLVGNLLDMSRIESGALKPQRRWNTIEEIATGVATKMRKRMVNHLLKMNFPPNLPLVPTDFVMIEQVFTNLISNSIKYAPTGTLITIEAKNEGECLHTQVANESPQVREEDLERIFDKFYRVTASDRVTGTGLGLSICKGIIEAHGGKIWAENQPDRFVFHFLLPLMLDGALPNVPEEVKDG